jgi:hypothetical protein
VNIITDRRPSLSCGFPPLLPTELDWMQRPLTVGVGLHGLAPTPGILVGCVAVALTLSGKANIQFVGTDGHTDTVGC